MIDYSHDKRPNEADVQRLLQQTDWAGKRSLNTIATMLDNSINVCVWEGETLVGYARAVSDGCYRSYIEDVIVFE